MIELGTYRHPYDFLLHQPCELTVVKSYHIAVLAFVILLIVPLSAQEPTTIIKQNSQMLEFIKILQKEKSMQKDDDNFNIDDIMKVHDELNKNGY